MRCTTTWISRLAFVATLTAAPTGRVSAADGPVTSQEVTAFVDGLDEAIMAEDVSGYRTLFDLDELFDRVTGGIDASPRTRAEFRRGAEGGFNQTGVLIRPLIDMVKQGGQIGFLRSRTRDKNPTALLRFRTGDGKVGYTEFYLKRSRDGKVRAYDYYSYFSGELGTQTIRRGYLSLVAFEGRGVISRLVGSDREYVDSLATQGKMHEHTRAGRFKEAEEARLSLPETVRERKENLLFAVMIGQELDEASYLKAIDALQKNLPDDPCVYLHLIDKYTLTKDFDNALGEVDRLDRSVGGDPFLDFQRTYLELLAGRLDRARSHALKLGESNPNDFGCRMAVVDVDLKRKDFPAVLATLKEVDEAFDAGIGELPAGDPYDEFIKSAEYPKWLAYIKARDGEPAEKP